MRRAGAASFVSGLVGGAFAAVFDQERRSSTTGPYVRHRPGRVH